MHSNTVINTLNPSDVKLKIETMIAEQKCKSIQEQHVLDYNLLFKDPDFGPEK